MKIRGVDKAVSLVDKTDGALLGSAVVTTRDKLKDVKPPEEKKTKKIHTYLKPAEYEDFLSCIGRTPASNALRDLVIEFIEKNKANK